jgi:DNA recombination protein RmuC
MAVVLAIFAGVLAGAVVVWMITSARSSVLTARLAGAEREASTLKAELVAARSETSAVNDTLQQSRAQVARLESDLAHERQASEEKLALVARASEDLKNTFAALASQALQTNNQSFLELARTQLETLHEKTKGEIGTRQEAIHALVEPIKTALGQINNQIQQSESSRREAYGSLRTQVEKLVLTERELQSQTTKLVNALRAPAVRGRWGEIQLRRVVEIAGMRDHCDFDEQKTVSGDDGRLRPDLIVRLPGGKVVIVDAKAPLQAYLDAVEATEEEVRRDCLKNHARQVREHMGKLSQKAYWEQFPSADMVVMFLPGEMFFSAALEQEPELIENGIAQKVIPASPTTLIALLRAIAYGWQQEKIAENAQQIAKLGKDLYERLCKFSEHMNDMRRGLDVAVKSYNKAVGTMEGRVFVPARKLADLGATTKNDLFELAPIEETTRLLQGADWESNTQLQIAAAAATNEGD